MSYLYTNNNVGKESVVLNNSISSQTLNGTIADITGSVISYTPILGCKKVIYDYKFQIDYLPDTNGNYYIELFEDTGSGYSGMGNYYCIEGIGNNVQFDNKIHIKFVLPSYTGSRSYKLRGRTWSDSYEITLNEDTANSQIYYPTVAMYSI